jgi:hypothetical protein
VILPDGLTTRPGYLAMSKLIDRDPRNLLWIPNSGSCNPDDAPRNQFTDRIIAINQAETAKRPAIRSL